MLVKLTLKIPTNIESFQKVPVPDTTTARLNQDSKSQRKDFHKNG